MLLVRRMFTRSHWTWNSDVEVFQSCLKMHHCDIQKQIPALALIDWYGEFLIS